MLTKQHIVTILGLLLTIGTANSQRIADTNRIWSNLVYDYWHYPQHSTHYTRIGNDTTVNDTLFHFVLRSDDEQKESWYRIGYLREDSINSVFFRNALTSNEILILDFNV